MRDTLAAGRCERAECTQGSTDQQLGCERIRVARCDGFEKGNTFVRVTGGTLAGRILTVPRRGVRPTADRVRESLFATLGNLEGLTVLDLYAGTGALGIEALSRGATSVLFVERSRQSVLALVKNLDALGVTARARVRQKAVLPSLRDLGRGKARFDLVLADPPYASDQLAQLLPTLIEAGVLESGARVVVERDRRSPLPAVPGLDLEDERIYGETAIMRFVATPAAARAGAAEPPARSELPKAELPNRTQRTQERDDPNG